MSTLEQATRYALYGWHIFPVEGKTPLVRWSTEATISLETIEAWWGETYPGAGIGIACGPSNLLVVDIDQGADLSTLADLGVDPSTATCVARTGSGGTHIYYAGHPGVKNSVSKVGAHIDIRSAGGFVVAPPSPHPSGGTYEWLRKGDPEPAPAPLIEALTRREPPPPATSLPPTGNRHERWGFAILEGEVVAVESAAPGTRNDTLFRAGCAVFGAVKGGHLDKATAEIRLTQAGLACGLDGSEVARTLASAWEDTEPRHPETKPAEVPTLEPSRSRRGLRVLSVEDLEALPPPRWLLSHRLPEGQTWMYGEPGSGKTFLALDWAAAVAASGLTVVYCVGEGVQGFAQRVSAIRAHFPGKDLSQLLIVPQAPALMQADSVVELRETVARYQPALLVVDTFARASVGADENSAKDVGLAIDVLDGLWHDHRCSSLVIHHSTKNSNSERGSSAIRGAADATWEVQPMAGIDYSQAGQAICRKMKDADRPEPWYFQLRASGPSAIVYPSALQ